MPTQKYLVILRSAPGRREAPSPAQMQEMYASFNAWREKFKASIVDMGGKLKPGGKILTTSGVTDGPLVETKVAAIGRRRRVLAVPRRSGDRGRALPCAFLSTNPLG
jgi:hypothetical protein